MSVTGRGVVADTLERESVLCGAVDDLAFSPVAQMDDCVQSRRDPADIDALLALWVPEPERGS